jgi:hypothetical protein
VSGGHTRAQFLGTGAAAIGGAALASAWGAAERADAQTADGEAKVIQEQEQGFGVGFVGDRFFFKLDEAKDGNFVQGVTGGLPSADIVIEKLGPDNIQHKHLAGVKWSDITVQSAVGMSKGFYEWIKASMDRTYARKNGAIQACDFNFRVKAIGQFEDALLTEVGFPALDAGAKDAAKMTLKIAPDRTSVKKGSGKISSAGSKIHDVTVKMEIEGPSSSRIASIDSFTWKQSVADVGTPPVIEVPDLSVWLSEGSGFNTWSGWFEDFVINGNNGQDAEKTGALSFYRGTTPVASVGFTGLGIFKLTPEKVEAGSETIRRVKAEMYCEDMTFSFPASTGG